MNKEEKLLEFIIGYQANEGKTPSLGAIAELHLGGKDKKPHAQYLVNKLVEQGRLKRTFINKLEII